MTIIAIMMAVMNVILISWLFYVRRNWIDNSNKLLYNILTNAANHESLSENVNKIVFTIKDFFKLDYATLYIYDKKDRQKLLLLSTTAEKQYIDKILKRGQQLIEETNNRNDAYIESSKSTLYYDSAKERDIKYMYFIKLVHGKEIIGALMVESVSGKGMSILEIDFFKSVVDSVTVYLQNIKFRRNELEQNNKDGLTGALNRRMFDNDIREISRKYIDQNQTYSIVMLDIDHFKKINDTYGHLCGDEVLKILVNTVTENIREMDTMYRYGGEEFCIVMPNTTPDGIEKHINDIREKIMKKEIPFGDKKIYITCSFGISGIPRDGTNPKDVIEKADKALYEAKNNGRNRVIAKLC